VVEAATQLILFHHRFQVTTGRRLAGQAELGIVARIVKQSRSEFFRWPTAALWLKVAKFSMIRAPQVEAIDSRHSVIHFAPVNLPPVKYFSPTQ